MAENLRGVVPGQLRPAGGFAQRSAAWPDRDPRELVDLDLFDGNGQRIAALGAFEIDWADDWVCQRGNAVEPRPTRRDGFVRRRTKPSRRVGRGSTAFPRWQTQSSAQSISKAPSAAIRWPFPSKRSRSTSSRGSRSGQAADLWANPPAGRSCPGT